MTVVHLRRVGVPAIARRDDGTWRLWAYEEAQQRAVAPLVPPIVVEVTPTCPDKRGVAAASSYFQVVEQMLDGLLGAQVIPSLDALVTIRLNRTQINGELAVNMVLSDAAEPF